MKLDFFKTINTNERAYWLGFLLADGYIGRNGNFTRLILSIKDEDQVDRFILAIEGDHNEKRYYGPYKTAGKSVHFSVRNKEFTSNLISLGCVNKKSYIARFPTLLSEQLMLSCLLGLYDGDGCQGQATITTGSYQLLQDIRSYWSLTGYVNSRPGKYGEIYNFGIGMKLLRETQYVYQNSMPRKRLINIITKTGQCSVCRLPNSIGSLLCYKCFNTKQEKIMWPSKEELAELLWQIPTEKIGKRLGVSGKAVEKHVRRLGLSKPGRGYWARNH